MQLKLSEKLFSFTCNKNLKWGDTRKKSVEDSELLKIQEEEWSMFWARFGLPEPEFRGKEVIDYGSGFGFDSLFMLKAGAKHVYCLEVSEDRLEKCRNLHISHGYQNASYVNNSNVELLTEKINSNSVDIIVCRDVMEHVPFPYETLKSMYDVLKPLGNAFIGFSPLYKSPYGPHILPYCKLPYVHLLFSEKTIMNTLKKLYSLPDTINSYIDIPGSGVNKLSYYNYLKYLKSFKWQISNLRMNSFEGKKFLGRILNLTVATIPIRPVKELFIVSSYIKLTKKG